MISSEGGAPIVNLAVSEKHSHRPTDRWVAYIEFCTGVVDVSANIKDELSGSKRNLGLINRAIDHHSQGCNCAPSVLGVVRI